MSDAEQSKLKPCPFCGGENIKISTIYERARVWCGTCGGSMIHFSLDDAVDLWNKRPNQYNKARYAQRKKEGRCVHCGANIENTEGVLCNECKGKNAESSRYNRKKKKLIEEAL